MGSLSVALVGNERQCCCEVHTGCVRDKKGGVAVCYPSLFFYAIILHRGDLMFKMDISRLKLYFYLLFILFISFSFIVVPKERSRKNMKQTKIVDYVLFSRENREIVTTFLYFPNEDLTYEQWLNKTRSTLEKDNKSTQFNYDEYDKYCTIVKQVDTNSANLLSSRSRRYLAVIGSLSFIGRQVA